jgi:hypothetical protein
MPCCLAAPVTDVLSCSTGVPLGDDENHVYALLNERARRERPSGGPVPRTCTMPALFGTERRLPPHLSTGAGVVGLALGSDNENRRRRGRLIVRCSKHTTAVIDGIIHDTHDPSRGGTRCVYDYFTKGTGAGNVA